jgi:hypothetical protein
MYQTNRQYIAIGKFIFALIPAIMLFGIGHLIGVGGQQSIVMGIAGFCFGVFITS